MSIGKAGPEFSDTEVSIEIERRLRAWWGILLMAVLGLWYVPFSALINIVVIVLLSLPSPCECHFRESN